MNPLNYMRLHDYSSRNSRQHWINASNGKIRNAFDGLGADEAAWEAAGFPFLTQRNPRDARGCHSDRLDATVHKPIGQRLEIHGVGAKGAHDLLIIAVGHTSHDLMRANVDARSVWVNLAHALERTGCALRGSSTIAFTQFAHGILLRRTHEQDETRPSAITRNHLWSIACSS